jgi:hypothetical protein
MKRFAKAKKPKPLKRNFVFLLVDLPDWIDADETTRIATVRTQMRAKTYHNCWAFSVPREPNRALVRVTKSKEGAITAQACGKSYVHPVHGLTYKPVEKSTTYNIK